MKIPYRLQNFLFKLFLPHHWVSNHSTCWAYDRKLRELLDSQPEFTKLGAYTVEISGVEIWISNYPYAYGRIQKYREHTPLPSSLTRYKLKKAIDKAWAAKMENTFNEVFKK